MVCGLELRRCVSALCMFHKIRCNHNHSLEAASPEVHVLARLTRLVVSAGFRYLDVPRSNTVQFNRSFVSVCVQ